MYLYLPLCESFNQSMNSVLEETSETPNQLSVGMAYSTHFILMLVSPDTHPPNRNGLFHPFCWWRTPCKEINSGVMRTHTSFNGRPTFQRWSSKWGGLSPLIEKITISIIPLSWFDRPIYCKLLFKSWRLVEPKWRIFGVWRKNMGKHHKSFSDKKTGKKLVNFWSSLLVLRLCSVLAGEQSFFHFTLSHKERVDGELPVNTKISNSIPPTASFHATYTHPQDSEL